MLDKLDQDQKRYYTIGEVADLFEVSKSQIRFWENEFALLKPHKNSKGDRRFTARNIEQIKTIIHLLKERGFTISGAKKELARQKQQEKEKKEMLEKLQTIRTFLKEIKDKL